MASRVFYTGLCAITCACLTFAPFSLRADVADELQKKLNAQKETLKDIDAKIAEFKQKVQEKRQCIILYLPKKLRVLLHPFYGKEDRQFYL